MNMPVGIIRPEMTADNLPNKLGHTYSADRVIGSGSFGLVYQATVVETGEIVAIKKVFQDKRYKNRELQIMKELNHPHVINLRQAFYTTGDKPEEVFLNVVMDFLSDTVHRIMKCYLKAKQSLPGILVKAYAYQMFRALIYLDKVGICHRDIKPQNLLVDGRTHTLKICDFGSAKKLVAGEPNVSYICSRYYRAPELIFGATQYSDAIDVWSAGCVVGEMILGQPLFPGECGVDQLVEIIKVLGTPTKEQLLAMNPNYSEFRFPNIKSSPWSKVFKGKPVGTDDAIGFMNSVLTFDPKERRKPVECLTHSFFDELRQQVIAPPVAIPNYTYSGVSTTASSSQGGPMGPNGASSGLNGQGTGKGLLSSYAVPNMTSYMTELPFALQPDQLFNFTPEEVDNIMSLANGAEIRAKLVPSWYRRPQGDKSSISEGAATGVTMSSATSFSGPQIKVRPNSRSMPESS